MSKLLEGKYIIFFSIVVIISILTHVFKSKIIHIKYDDKLAEFLINKINFKNIHPNIVSITGLILNFIIMYLFYNNIKFKDLILIILLIIRYLSDILDGAIARKFVKTSKFGHLLDTMSDIILSFVFLMLFNLKLKMPIICIVICFIIIIIYYNIKHHFFEEHDTIKKNFFYVNNTYISFIYAFIFYKL